MRIAICACQVYHRIPTEKVDRVVQAARQTDGACECRVVPELCFIAARDPDELRRVAGCEVVLACQTRAVRSFFRDMPAPECVDLRATPLADVLATLGLNPATEPSGVPGDAAGGVECEPVPSDWIPWFPTLDPARCIGCKKCVDFCMFGVYAVGESGGGSVAVRVVSPDACKTDCPACARMCPANAIMFPKSEESALNGALSEVVKPSGESTLPLRERLRRRNAPRLFREDAE